MSPVMLDFLEDENLNFFDESRVKSKTEIYTKRERNESDEYCHDENLMA